MKKRFMGCFLAVALAVTGCSSEGNNGGGKQVSQETEKQQSEAKQTENGEKETASLDTEDGEKGQETVKVTGTPKRVAVHDPSVAVGKDGTYYVFGSHIASAKSTDLVDWNFFANGYATRDNVLYGSLSENLDESFQWAGRNDSDCLNGYAVWAPFVFWNDQYINKDGSKGAYMIYYCTSSTYIRSCIGYAVSQEIEGPYEYVDTIVYSGFTKKKAYDQNSKVNKCYKNTNIPKLIKEGKLDGINEQWFTGTQGFNNSYAPNAIDPALFFDTEGKLWMTYGSWSGGIFLLEIDPETGEALYPGKSEKTEDDRIIDSYFGTRIAGGYTVSGEGPFVIYDEETQYYYLYVTYEYLDAVSGYNMRLFRSKTPEGPYEDSKGNNAALPGKVGHNDYGIKVMGNYTMAALQWKAVGGYRSCGHNSALIDRDGSRYLLYHTRFQFNPGPFELRVHQQFMNSKGWPVTAVFENRGDKISETGYSTESIVGDYEFINHGIQCDKENMLEVQNVTLNEDGTISGDIEGTWSETEDSYLAEFVIDDVAYSGVFFLQHDEDSAPKEVMTFTAIGDNKTIWGIRK